MNNRRDRKAHVKKRLKQRYNIDTTKHERAEIKQSIKDGDSVFVEKRGEDREVHDVPFKGIMVRVVYNEKLDQIITALPGPDSIRWRVEYVNRNDEHVFVEIEADGKLLASNKVRLLYDPKEVRSVTPLKDHLPK